MELIPIIYLKKRKKYSDINTKNNISDEEIIDVLSLYKNLYLYDMDGIKSNKPNYCTYQRFSTLAELWIDSAPRNMGDIVDNLMAGGNNIVIQEQKWIGGILSDIKNITQNNIFCKIEDESIEYYKMLYKEGIEGLIILKNHEEIQNNFTFKNYVKTLAEKTSLYGFESNPKNLSYWKNIKAKGVFIEIDKIKEFDKINEI